MRLLISALRSVPRFKLGKVTCSTRALAAKLQGVQSRLAMAIREGAPQHTALEKCRCGGAFSTELLYPYDKFLDSSYDPEVTVRTHILAIIDYLSRIQEK